MICFVSAVWRGRHPKSTTNLMAHCVAFWLAFGIMRTHYYINPKNWRKETFLTAMPILAVSIVCLLANGCATTTTQNLTADELRTLKKTQTVLIKADGVKGTQKDFFVGLFKHQLTMNAATPVTEEEKGQPTSGYDAVITLKCYYFDHGQYTLRRPADLEVPIGGNTSATGVGKRVGCRVTIVHKQLGRLFDGQIEGKTSEAERLSPDDVKIALSTSGGFSSYLEESAQLNFKDKLEHSQAWYVVKNMRPKD